MTSAQNVLGTWTIELIELTDLIELIELSEIHCVAMYKRERCIRSGHGNRRTQDVELRHQHNQ